GTAGQAGCRAKPGLGDCGSARLAIHRADGPVRRGFATAVIELVENGERGLSVAARLLIARALEPRLGKVHEAQTLEIQIARVLGDFEALAQVAVGPVVLP